MSDPGLVYRGVKIQRLPVTGVQYRQDNPDFPNLKWHFASSLAEAKRVIDRALDRHDAKGSVVEDGALVPRQMAYDPH